MKEFIERLTKSYLRTNKVREFFLNNLYLENRNLIIYSRRVVALPLGLGEALMELLECGL